MGPPTCLMGAARLLLLVTSKSMLALMLFASSSVPSVAGQMCEPFCRDAPCSDLNGNVAIECGTCDESHACGPGAPGFRHTMDPAPSAADEPIQQEPPMPEEPTLMQVSLVQASLPPGAFCVDNDAALQALGGATPEFASISASGAAESMTAHGDRANASLCSSAVGLCQHDHNVARACAQTCGTCADTRLLFVTSSGVWQLATRCDLAFPGTKQPVNHARASANGEGDTLAGFALPISSDARAAAAGVAGRECIEPEGLGATANGALPRCHLTYRHMYRTLRGGLQLGSLGGFDGWAVETLDPDVVGRVEESCRRATAGGEHYLRYAGLEAWSSCAAAPADQLHFHDFRHTFHSDEVVRAKAKVDSIYAGDTGVNEAGTCQVARHRAVYGARYALGEQLAPPALSDEPPAAPPAEPAPAPPLASLPSAPSAPGMPRPGHMESFGYQGQPATHVAEVQGCLSARDFAVRHVYAHQPVVLRGCGTQSLPAVQKWSDSYLNETAPEHVARHPGCRNTTLSNFLSHYQQFDRGGTEHEYGYRICNQLPRALLKDVVVPPMLRCPQLLTAVENAVMWFSNGRQRSRLHFDPNDGAQICPAEYLLRGAAPLSSHVGRTGAPTCRTCIVSTHWRSHLHLSRACSAHRDGRRRQGGHPGGPSGLPRVIRRLP